MVATHGVQVTVSRGLRNWAEATIVFSGWLVGALIVSLLLWVVTPMLALGWKPMVVTSGSMSPLIRTGDVVMIDPEFKSPGEGSVVAFNSGDDVMIHRIVSAERDGTLISKGDANPRPDSSPIAAEDVIGTGRLLVPYLGLTRVIGWAWWGAVLAIGMMAALVWRSRPSLSASLVAVLVGLAALGVASAAFAAATDNTGSSLAAVDIEPATNLVASCGLIGAGGVQVNLSWTASTTTEMTGYLIQYDPPGSTSWTPVGTVGSSQTTFTHTVDVAGTHAYAVEALVGAWASRFSNTDTVDITRILGIYTCTGL
jgi:signal peptidase I